MQKQEIIKRLGGNLAETQSYIYHTKCRYEKLNRPFPKMSFEEGKIQGLREGLFAIGLSQKQIDEIQWGFPTIK
jgi:hypothetical protein